MNDDELRDLFSAFDDVSASDSLQASTLDFIMSSAAAAPETAEAEGTPSQVPAVTVERGGKARVRNRWRAMRTAAVAACLALALTGGAAYAYPASTVVVTQGDTTIEMQVNVFGQVLSASANDRETQDLIDHMGLVNTQYADSVSRVSDSLKESNPKTPVEVVLNGIAQSVETGDEPTQPQEPQEQVPQLETAPLATDESAVLKVELPVVESEPVVVSTIEDSGSPAYLPEPSVTVATDDETPKADRGSKRPIEREVPEVSQDPVKEDTGTGADAAEEVPDEPIQPVVVDDDADESPAAEPSSDESSSSSAADDAQSEKEAERETTRTPRYRSIE